MKREKTFLLTFYVMVLLTGCSMDLDQDSRAFQTKFELLQGDWVTQKYSHGHRLTHFHINVEDSIFTMLSEYSDSAKFSLNEDQIIVYDSTHTYNFGKSQKYKIEKLDQEELFLIPKSNKVKKQLKKWNWQSDTLSFQRVQMSNSLKPIRIGFSSLGCYGSCPSMKLQITDDLNLIFFGGIHSDIEGGYSGRINKKTYRSIINQIQYLQLDSLKPEYAAPWTDDQTRYLIIETKDTTIKTQAYGRFKEPVELTIILDNLMDLYKRANIIKTESINDSTSFHPYLKISRPIPLPPIFFER